MTEPSQNALECSESERGAHIQNQPPGDEVGQGSIPETSPEALFDPLHDCPTKPRYERTAQKAREGSAFQAVKLKCLDCSGWYYREAKTCEIKTCALWLLNRRIFKRAK